MHASLHAMPEDVARYRGRYDGGRDRLREERFARQMEVYAAIVDRIDQNVGRLVGALGELGGREVRIGPLVPWRR